MKMKQLAEGGCIVVCQGKDCRKAGAAKLRKALEKAADEADAKVMVLKSGCMGRCGKAPVVIAWPGGVCFTEAAPGDTAEILLAAGVKPKADKKKDGGKEKKAKKEKKEKGDSSAKKAVAKAEKEAKVKGKTKKSAKEDKKTEDTVVPPKDGVPIPEGQGYAE